MNISEKVRRKQNILLQNNIIAEIKRVERKNYQLIINFEVIKVFKKRESCNNRIMKL